MPTDPASPGQPPKLACLGGNPAPREIVEGWKRFRGFADDAKRAFWPVLRQLLLAPPGIETGEALAAFGREAGIPPHDVQAAAAACEILVRRGSALDLPLEALRQDLTALSGGTGDGFEVVLAHYEALKAGLRQQALLDSIADHGKLLVGLSWRVDQMHATDRASGLNASVILLSLVYREGDKLERISLQLTAEAMRDLKAFCNRFEA